MINTVRIRAALLSMMAVMTGFLSLLFLGTTSFRSPMHYGCVQLDNGWTISRDGKTKEIESIRNATLALTKNGDSLILKRRLPRSDIFPATIFFHTILSSVDVYLDDELIYTFGGNYLSSGKMLPKMENFVALPDYYPDKELRIIITAREDDAFSGLTPIYFGNYNDIKNRILQNNRFSMIIGIYLCHLGFMLMILSPFLAFAENHDYSILFSALTSLALGVYILCYYDIFWYLSDNPYFYTIVEYIVLFMIPEVILGFVITSGNTNFNKILTGVFCMNLSALVIVMILHLTNAVHICNFVTAFHLISVLEGIALIASLIISAVMAGRSDKSLQSMVTSTHILVLGLVIFLACSVIDIIKFNVLKYSQAGEINAHIGLMTVGALFFIMCLLLNYFFHCIEYSNESTVRIQLEGIAYTDALTGLSNRAHCEQMLARLKGDYTIISLDLDYLKYTNDNYGHDKGDQLISGFGDILKNSFTDASLVGRMGGDEFIVILPFVDTERTERDLNGFSDLLSYRNTLDTSLRYSASWGYASSNEAEPGSSLKAQNIYLLADNRMYTMKNKHHKQSLGRLYDDLLNKLAERR